MDLLDSSTYTSTETSTLKSLHVQEVLDTRSQRYLPLSDAIAAGLFDEKKGSCPTGTCVLSLLCCGGMCTICCHLFVVLVHSCCHLFVMLVHVCCHLFVVLIHICCHPFIILVHVLYIVTNL